MKKQLVVFLILFVSFHLSLFAQQDDSLFSRLQAISNNGAIFYNADGFEITSQIINADFSKKNVLKKFKKYSIKESDLITSDSSIQAPNYFVSKKEEISTGVIQHTSYYFVENKNKTITAITLGCYNKNDKAFESKMVNVIVNDEIPKYVYTPMEVDSINFAGRKIALGKSCHWMGINNIQCPYYGQMNWSVHRTLDDAAKSASNQYSVINNKKGGKIISEEMVDVIFEGTEVKAKKAVYDFKGVTSLLVGMSGGKTLTIYFVASPAKQNFVSCVMSFWNNDNINPSGLPPLLEQVMQLKK
ncbi:MAG: hypothetical protein QM802_19245 [Agriterribacter sp.]